MTDDARASGVFGLWLCACRRSAGLSQEELAERSGLTARAVREMERGRTRWPHPDSVRRLADALELSGQERSEFVAMARRRLPGAADTGLTRPKGRPPNAGSGPHASGGRRADGRETGSGSFSSAVPRQLPLEVRHFTGRAAEMARLTELAREAGNEGAMAVSVISGMAGAGKTTLAVHWAHQAARLFPDGQLYVNLRGFGPSAAPAAPAEVIRDLLDAFGVAPERIPASFEAQAGLYRSLVAGQRLVIVLDNARDVDQVRPLLPGAPGCFVVVTSRAPLTGLAVSESAQLITLDLLSEAEARELLTLRLGTGRAAAEPAAVSELIGLCARLPLALAITAARAVGHSPLRLADLAAELRDAASRLDALDAGDVSSSIRAVFSWSYKRLQDPDARMFRLLGVHPGPDIAAAAAASLAGVPVPVARRTLRDLTAAHLLTEHSPGRFALHDLLRAYATERAQAEHSDADRRQATVRVFDHYLHTAHAAARLLHEFNPWIRLVILAPVASATTPEHLASHEAAMAWFEVEHRVLISATAMAADTGFDGYAWQLPATVYDFLDRCGRWNESAALQHTALAATIRLGDTAAQAATKRALAASHTQLGDYDEARALLSSSIQLCRQIADQLGEAAAYRDLGGVAESQGRVGEALGLVEQALSLYRATDYPVGRAAALNNAAAYHALLGNYQRSQAFCREALAVQRQIGHSLGEGCSWANLGYAEHHLGHFTEAMACYQRSLSIFRELEHRYKEAETLAMLGDACQTSGHPDAARDRWHEALDILDGLHHPDADQVRAKLTSPETCVDDIATVDDCRSMEAPTGP